MLLLDDTSPSAVVVDTRIPPSAGRLMAAISEAWPRLAGRVSYIEQDLRSVPIERTDVVVSAHACGALTDDVLKRAADVRARVGVLPCCHDEQTCDAGGLSAWMDLSLAVDATRVAWLRARGYAVHTHVLPAEITAKNRLLLGAPIA